MKRAFTLIEMMIVVAILVTLMTIVFRLANLGQNSEKHTRTVVRLQRLENCLSGYMAAFGSYPPVKLHGTRDIYMAAEGGMQDPDNRNENLWDWTEIGQKNEQKAWAQVELACRAQPVDCRFPFPEEWNERIRDASDMMKEYAQTEKWEELDEERRAVISGGFSSICENPGRLNQTKDETDWNNMKLFKFGLMSFLLPRYMIMTGGPQTFYTQFKQWTDSNQMPSDPFTGRKFGLGNETEGWTEIWDLQRKAQEYLDTGKGSARNAAQLMNIPSQAACARWIANLEGICTCNRYTLKLFGVELKSNTDLPYLDYKNLDIEVYRPKGRSPGADQYVLDGVTLKDGWGHEFFYYSPVPYQRYSLWSAGANGRTFPVWISRDKLPGTANDCVNKWTHDDIIQMSH